MKKVFSKKDFGKMSAIVCGFMTMFSLAACSDHLDVVDGGTPQSSEQAESYVNPPTQPTTDAMTVTVSGSTYVFNGNYTGEAKALVNRVTTSAASLQENGVKNIIIHGSRIASLTNKETADLLLQMSRGASLVVADPTADNIKVLAKRLHDVIDDYSIGGNNEEVRSEVNQIIGSKVFDRILSWTDNVIDHAFKNKENLTNHITVLAIRDNDSYMSFRDSQPDTDEFTLVVNDEKRNPKEQTTISVASETPMNDYHYGEKGDILAKWLNTPAETPEAQEKGRQAAAKMMATRAGGRAEDYLDKITDSQDLTYPIGFKVSGPEGHNPFHNIVVKYRIWTAHSGEKNADIYCVTQEITLFNQDLKCGPSDKYKWYDGREWGPWKELSKKVTDLCKYVYGPYMYQVDMKCTLVDFGHKVTLEEYAPMNSTSGGQTVSDGISYSLGGGVSAKPSGGPEAKISASVQWSHSVSKFNADLTMTASPTPDGTTHWVYTAKEPDSHFNMNVYDALKNGGTTHDTAVSISTSTCTLQQAWVWTVKYDKSSIVLLQPIVKVWDHWLLCDRALNHPAEAVPHYIGLSSDAKSIPDYIIIHCPPRYHQTWSMNVESKDVDASKLKEIESFLASHLDKYFMPTCVFSTMNPEHKRATGVADSDEVAEFVSKCKQAFASTSGRELLREAGKRAGLSDKGSYTIVWRHTDLDVNSDREEFTFHMSEN